ncbi:MAG: aspartate carbamoyltransferase [Firmicutes bacterium]|nr:aspartate carbamoyltransferase [Bacillota bacterium]
MIGGIVRPAQEKLDRFKGRNILDIDSLTREDIETIMETAAYYDQALTEKQRLYDMDGKIMASLFFEPSTRTRLSFEAAMERLGGKIISVSETPEFQISSTARGETLHDSIRVVNGYCDVIVCRSSVSGARQEINEAAAVPYINAGDGTGEHPTQALLDVYTIYKEKGCVDGLDYLICGDLKYGRAPHSFLNALTKFRPRRIILASPAGLNMPGEYVAKAAMLPGTEVVECRDLASAVGEADVIYTTRIQRRRYASEEDYFQSKDRFVMKESFLPSLRPGAIIMDPLPRIREIELAVDDYPGAAYFRQAGNGVPVRMAVLSLLTGSVR